MRLSGIWYNDFSGAESDTFLSYDLYVLHFSAYFQHGYMKGNVKCLTYRAE